MMKTRPSRAGPVPPENVLHAVFELKLALLEGDFFELFGF